MSLIRVQVPASSANLGSGYDTVGIALTFYNVFEVIELLPKGKYELDIIGEGGGDLDDPSSNTIVMSYEAACRRWNMDPPGLKLRSLNAIPLCRGLGSSSSAIVGGVCIANALREDPLSREDLLPLMVEIEGHPDNIVPCCLGGMVVSCWDGKELRYVRMPSLPPELVVVVAVPEYRVCTEDARAALPKTVSMEDAVFNLSRAALLAASWATGNWDNLPWAMADRLHQPFRAKLFPGGEAILERLRSISGCAGVAISGSGPTMLAFVRGNPQTVAEPMCHIFSEAGVKSRFFVLDVDKEGVRVISNV